ncbi:Glycosyl hydrolase family 32 domain protein [Emticicia oligotrophica DSM 17448]|uniref:Glycosyl hydrolase family 32 domain protein n=1 Tax=Emticicia oligotrophica (strain DSM 17448 / CIP 109782 / MTCC 6937 / GPTSA100-15) TaxID=929562 RepID=A0ABM5N366_EMTOG|nr:glycoside hydrolase family 43 protein [Emticicia oligotrophica]AFK03839.1 Glycosyl hydrolase family 32 domain protein [Emticicia oligotrophica DSM 17448]
MNPSKIVGLLLLFINHLTFAQKDVYLFSYFTDNGQDGLHFAYSKDGQNWTSLKEGKSFLTPAVGKDKLMRDPCIIQANDGTFHMVWTSGWHDQIIGYASSKDLINWSEQKAIPVMEHEPTAKNSWAPEVFYDDKKKNYLIFWATTIPGRHGDIADSEREKGWNHRIYATETIDFKTFSPTKLYFNPDFSAIDATILKDGKSYFMFIKNENPNPPQKNIRIIKSDKPSVFDVNKVSDPITGNYWAEGPTSIRIGEYVYVYFDKYRDHKYGAIRSKDMKNWEDISEQVSFPKGLRHGTVLKVSEEVFEGLKK